MPPQKHSIASMLALLLPAVSNGAAQVPAPRRLVDVTEPAPPPTYLDRETPLEVIALSADSLFLPAGIGPLQRYGIGEPTPEEQLYLECINRARANPSAEAIRLRDTTDPDIIAAYRGW